LEIGAIQCFFNLHKYTLLHGLRLSKEDHVFFIKVAYNLFICENMDSRGLERIGQVLQALLKKKWLLSREDLELPWKPLFDLWYLYEESSEAAR